MVSPYDLAFGVLQSALVDLDGDGKPDVAVPVQSRDPMREINRRLPEMSPMTRAGFRGGEIRNAEPQTNALLDAATMPARMFVEQAQSAGGATAKAVDDPTLANVTNAGVQNALLLGRPVTAGVMGGVGLLEAARRDYAPEIFPSATAQDDPLSPDQRRRLRQLSSRRDLTPGQRDELASLNKIVTDVATRKATAGIEGEEEGKRLERERYDAQTRKAMAGRDAALARDRRFSDTEVGKVFNETGGLAPYIAGATFGAVSRLGTGPGTSTAGKVWNQYVEPALVGGLAGVGAANAPLIADAYVTSEPYNPVKEAYEVYARELPEGHPDKVKAAEFARAQQPANPRREQAQKELADRGLMGLIWPAIEGAGSGMVASQGVNAMGRLGRAVGVADPLPAGGPKGTPASGGQVAPGGGLVPVSPTPQPPGGSPQPVQAQSFRTYSQAPQDVRDEAFNSYLATRNITGSPPPANATAGAMRSDLASNGINVPITPDRIRATEQAISEFIVANKREPRTPQDFAAVRMAATLALGGTVIGNALAPEQTRNALLP